MIRIEIDTSNAAFGVDDGRHEIARILRRLANQIEDCIDPEWLMDVNGDRCGTLEMNNNERTNRN